MSWMVAAWGLAVLALAAATAVVARRQRRLGELQAQALTLEAELALSKRLCAQAEADQQLLARLVRELPHLTHQMHARGAARQMAQLLLGAAVRLLEPAKAIVAVRRRAGDDPGRGFRLAIAAVSPDGAAAVGSEIPVGQGEIGFAVDVQRVMDRRDFESQPATVRRRLAEEATPGLRPELIAPLVFEEEVMGVIALEGLKRGSANAKDVLRLLAQVAAASAYAHARLTEMKTTADVDGLTGIFNKRYLMQRLAEAIQVALDRTRSVSIFMFDLDHFKHYNDHNGHLAGDQLLRQLAKLVQAITRSDTVFGRFGGEEFLVILPGADKQQALAAAENVRDAIASCPFAHGDEQPLGRVSISGGVAECPIDGTDSARLVRCADEALYVAKHAGRNLVLAFEPRYLDADAPHALPGVPS